MLAQKLKKSFKNQYELAENYYKVLFAYNNIQLTERELQLVAFIAVRGDMSNAKSKRDFVTLYRTTKATLDNTVSKLKKKKLLQKPNGKVVLIPQLQPDPSKGFTLIITSDVEQRGTGEDNELPI